MTFPANVYENSELVSLFIRQPTCIMVHFAHEDQGAVVRYKVSWSG